MIERILWSDHAELRLHERGLTRLEVEQVIREGHGSRQSNHGEADWRVYGIRSDGRRFAVVYDQPVLGDPALVRIVSVWALRDSAQS